MHNNYVHEDRAHKEKKPGEVLLCNHFPANILPGWKSTRLGFVAYDINGKQLPRSDKARPVFVNKEELEQAGIRIITAYDFRPGPKSFKLPPEKFTLEKFTLEKEDIEYFHQKPNWQKFTKVDLSRCSDDTQNEKIDKKYLEYFRQNPDFQKFTKVDLNRCSDDTQNEKLDDEPSGYKM